MKTHPNLYDESFRLEDLASEYQENKKYKELEKVLLDLVEIYDGLNYCDEDEYIEDLIKTYKRLGEIYLVNRDNKKLINTYEKIIENYDYIIQRDIHENELLNKHIKELQEIYLLYKKLNPKKNISKEYPRLKEYIEE